MKCYYDLRFTEEVTETNESQVLGRDECGSYREEPGTAPPQPVHRLGFILLHHTDDIKCEEKIKRQTYQLG